MVSKLIRPSAVMFDPVQKPILIGFFTNRDIYLNKLIPLLSVYLDQTNTCNDMMRVLEKQAHHQVSDIDKAKNAVDQAY